MWYVSRILENDGLGITGDVRRTNSYKVYYKTIEQLFCVRLDPRDVTHDTYCFVLIYVRGVCITRPPQASAPDTVHRAIGVTCHVSRADGFRSVPRKGVGHCSIF